MAEKPLMNPNTAPNADTSPRPIRRPGSRQLGLTTSQAARELGVSLSTVRRWSDMGYLRGYRTPGGQRRFSRDQIDAFLLSLEQGPSLGD
jgi:excisionase family DNA binding protein